MKKGLLLILCVLLLIVTGCGKDKQVACTGDAISDDGVTLHASVTGELDSNEKVVNIKHEFEFSDVTVANRYCNTLKSLETIRLGTKVTCSDKTIRIEGFDRINVAEPEVGEVVLNQTKNDFIRVAKLEEYTCQ